MAARRSTATPFYHFALAGHRERATGAGSFAFCPSRKESRPVFQPLGVVGGDLWATGFWGVFFHARGRPDCRRGFRSEYRCRTRSFEHVGDVLLIGRQLYASVAFPPNGLSPTVSGGVGRSPMARLTAAPWKNLSVPPAQVSAWSLQQQWPERSPSAMARAGTF